MIYGLYNILLLNHLFYKQKGHSFDIELAYAYNNSVNKLIMTYEPVWAIDNLEKSWTWNWYSPSSTNYFLKKLRKYERFVLKISKSKKISF